MLRCWEIIYLSPQRYLMAPCFASSTGIDDLCEDCFQEDYLHIFMPAIRMLIRVSPLNLTL
jgi:hypothetical protein